MNEALVDRILMSDALKGVVPDLEDSIKKYEDSFIVVSMLLNAGEDEDTYVSGPVVGLSFESSGVIKSDFKVRVAVAHSVMKKFTTGLLKCKTCFVTLGEDDIQLFGPFNVESPKVLDLDPQNKMCTLGVDLIPEGP